jgi:hypothetical protein
MPSEWAVEAVKGLRKRHASQQQQSGAMFERRKLLQEQGDILWKRVRQHVAELAEDFNAEVGSKAISVLPGPANELQARIAVWATRRELVAQFDASSVQEALHWTYDGGSTKGKQYELFVNEYGVVSIGSGLTTRSPEAIATEMLDGLLEE